MRKNSKYTQVLYQKVEHTNFYVNIPKNTYTYVEALVFSGFRVSRVLVSNSRSDEKENSNSLNSSL